MIVTRAVTFELMRSWLNWQVGLLALAVVILSAPNVMAQDARSLTSEMVGQWELSTAGRDKTCVITLKGDSGPQGSKLELDKGAAPRCPSPRVSWRGA